MLSNLVTFKMTGSM